MRTILFLFITCVLIETSFAQFNEFHPEYNWLTIKTKHSQVHFHAESERTAQVVAKIIEDVWEPISDLYQYEPETVHFVIKDIDDYSNGATFFFDNKIEIWASSLNFELRGTHNWLRNVISHEFTHMVQIQAGMKFGRKVPAVFLQFLNYEDIRRPDILYGFPNIIASYPIAGINIPAWFAEGTAQFMRKEFNYDNWDSHRDMILRQYALNNSMLSYNQMGVFSKNSLGSESVYNSGFSLTRYIGAKYGDEKIGEISRNLGSLFNFTFDAACKNSIGKSGEEIYSEWKDYLINSYKSKTKNIKENLVEGEEIRSEGFSNLYPLALDDKLVYISNKGFDYLGLSSIYIFDLKNNKEELIVSRVNSSLGFIKNENKLVYSKLDDNNKKLRKIHDIYTYDLETKEEKRITIGLRANNPNASPNGKKIVFIYQNDGTSNLGIINVDGTNFKRITNFANGEQVYNPKFLTDNNRVIFGYSKLSSRDLGLINIDGSSFEFISNNKYDERNPAVIDENKIIFSSDESGIYNLYEYDLSSETKKQITNVLGGAFMSAQGPDNTIYYAGYTHTGYKIFKLNNTASTKITKDDLYKQNKQNEFAGISGDKIKTDSTILHLRNFNDDLSSKMESKKYSGAFTSLSLMPFLRWDNYVTSNKGLAKIKPGLMVASSDMLNRYSIFGGGAINVNFERDLFLIFDYRNRLPLLYSLGLKPDLTLSIYSISRKTNSELLFDEFDATSNANADITYNLFEVDLAAKQRIFSNTSSIEFKYVYSKYSAAIGSFIFPNTTLLVPSTNDTYLIGSNLSLRFKYENYLPSVDKDINPIGTLFDISITQEMNRYNPDRKYNFEDGILKPVYKDFNFQRVELNWHEYIQVFKDHTLNFKLRAASILGPDVPDFFDFYLGGLIGMKSYPFYAISGNELGWLNMSYRMPLLKNIDLQIGHMYFDKLYFSVYGDFGNAWNGNKVKFSDFKKGIGAEFRLKMISYYVFPTSIFFSAAYSFDKFSRIVNEQQINYGKEFRIYGGILFEFNF